MNPIAKLTLSVAAFCCALPVFGIPNVSGTTNPARNAVSGSIYSDTLIDTGNTDYDGQDLVISGCTVTINGSHAFHSVSIVDHGVMTHSPGSDGQPNNRLSLTVTQDFSIDASSRVDVTGKGSPSAAGPGAGQSGNYAGGGSHGGVGGMGYYGLLGGATTYGSITQPVDWGSGSGDGNSPNTGGAGGGVARLIVNGSLFVNGVIAANGGDTAEIHGGGGSGGSLWLTAGTFTGSGTISANGGAGVATDGGGGGGGRVAVYYNANTFTGALMARGGFGFQYGGAGTVFTKAISSGAGDLLVENGNNWGPMTPLTNVESCSLTIGGMSEVYPNQPLTLTTLHLRTNSLLTHVTGQTGLVITVSGDALIAQGGRLDVSGRGSPSATGVGAGQSGNYAGGGSHGGIGGMGYYGLLGGATTHGSITQPMDLGSGSGDGNSPNTGGAGGGMVRMTVNGTLTVNGALIANGGGTAEVHGGGGSGGSLWLTVGTLAGSGVVSANGGAAVATCGGGGGGGRVAVYYIGNSFTGALTAQGGLGNQYGGAGTVYTKASILTVAELLVENGGFTGPTTPITSPAACSLTIGNMAEVYPVYPLILKDLHLLTNSLLTHLTGQTGLVVTVTGDLLIDAGGRLDVSGRGSLAATGAGAGRSGNYAGGGGHGGIGGTGYYGLAGGTTYGSITQPVDLGSGSGNGLSPNTGGAGGGVVRVIVNGALTVNGVVSANGGTPADARGGGGSGGSLWLTVGTLAGNGIISSDGGAGVPTDGGGGSGGRVAVYYNSSVFIGAIQARGGGGNQYGGAGTVYTKSSSSSVGDLIVENGGNTGQLTTLSTPEAFNLSLRSGAQAFPAFGQPLTLSSLDIGDLGVLTHRLGQKLNVTVLNQAIVRSNGSINVDGLGYTVGNNPGPGVGIDGGDTGSGGSYGGMGGTSWNNTPGGAIYGSASAPTDWGSAGGAADGGPRSFGGGAIRLNVGGSLTVDGSISANGGPASYNDQGNPSGGSVWLNAASVSGNGLISANGGSGNTYGGGGGGGRIAIYTPSQGFNGLVSAAGGRGWNYGASGTVVLGNYINSETPTVLAISPSSAVSGWVNAVEVTFNTAINAATFTPANVLLTTPAGALSSSQIVVTNVTPQIFRISFPRQTTDGVYSLQIGPNISSASGQPMASAYNGQFTIQWPRSITMTGSTNALHFAWPTQPGLVYQLQSSPDLTNWVNEGGPIAGASTTTAMDLVPGSASQRFYRLVLSWE